MSKTATIPWKPLSDKHKRYIRIGINKRMCVAEGAIRSGKTIDHCIMSAAYLETCADKIHLASGSTIGNAKLNIGVCNGFGLEALFRGRCHWGKYKDNEALYITTQTGEKVLIFAGGAKADSYKRILGNSYGLWIATEINEHYDCEDSRTSFVKVAQGRQLAAAEPYTLWDLNPCNPRHAIYSNYIDKYRDTMPGYQYQHFTISDNLSIGDTRRAEIMAQYDPKSTWYRRDILGERCVAEGLIYRQYADNPQQWYVGKEEIPKFLWILAGVDFGGNKSSHAYTAVGITADYREVYVLRSKTLPAEGVSVENLIDDFSKWSARVELDYGASIDYVYADSAEQTIINSMYQQTKYTVLNSVKGEIIDRIRCTDLLMTQGRLHLVRGECDSLEDALCSAVWDPDELDDVRLDNGSYNVDQLDSFEYAWSAYLPQLLRE